MDNVTKLLTQGAAGAAGGATYVDDVFSQYIWDGNATAGRSINNGIDFAGEGGAIWIKARNQGWSHRFWDTTRGATKFLYPDETHAEATDASGAANMLTSFDSNGVTLGQDSNAGGSNYPNTNYISWSFRKAPKFFDIVTWSGNDTAGRQIPHNLESVPGCIMVKKLSGAENWEVYHRAIDSTPQNYRIRLNTNDTRLGTLWNNTAPTATHFTLSSANNVNGSGDTYIAYLFAHNDGDGEFGEDGDKDIIKCTTYTGTSSGGQYVNLGWEPQWLLVKATDNSSGGGQDWYIFDALRGLKVASGDNPYLKANDNGAEHSGVSEMYRVDARGFIVDPGGTNYMNSNGRHYIVVAIRRSDGVVGKPPKVGTNVFAMDVGDLNSTGPIFDSTFPVDFAFHKDISSAYDWFTGARLMGPRYLRTNVYNHESAQSTIQWDFNNGWQDGSYFPTTNQSWMWKRHAGFDVSCYTGSGSADYVYHSLGQIPEMIWVKRRGNHADWRVYHKALGTSNDPFDYSLKLNGDGAQIDDATVWNDAAPEINRFTVGTHSDVNTSGSTYLSMIFASVTGICKIGSFTGNGTSQSISLGFQPRFLILKNATSTEKWYVLDTVRGWSSGGDQYMSLNTNYAQANGTFGEPTATGFDISGNDAWNNKSGDTFIYYAHA